MTPPRLRAGQRVWVRIPQPSYWGGPRLLRGVARANGARDTVWVDVESDSGLSGWYARAIVWTVCG